MDSDGPSTNAAALVTKLIEIGNLAKGDAHKLRSLIIEAQDCALVLQADMVKLLREIKELRSQAPGSRPFS